MNNSILQNSTTILNSLYQLSASSDETIGFNGNDIQKSTNLNPQEINDAISILEENGYVETQSFLGTAPFNFGILTITPRGKFEIERITEESTTLDDKKQSMIHDSINPVGSPYGFTDEDWEFVSENKSNLSKLFIVFGYQFKSNFYDTEKLKQNLENMLKKVIENYNSKENTIKINMEFMSLSAGYGEHLFNKIARDIISSDIAIFDTSDLNPNVMIELGVALTWGVRVLPIRKKGCPETPNDISGQTWAEYENDGSIFIDKEHEKKLYAMVERAAKKKAKA